MVDVCEKYAPLFDPKISEIVEPSGRCSAKTTSNEIAAISFMLKSRLNNIWYCRAETGDIRQTIFSRRKGKKDYTGGRAKYRYSGVKKCGNKEPVKFLFPPICRNKAYKRCKRCYIAFVAKA